MPQTPLIQAPTVDRRCHDRRPEWLPSWAARNVSGNQQVRSKRSGFSLVELLLALALAVVLVGLIGTMFSFYALKLDARDTEVRRIKLAQAILDMIGDDLRGALNPPEFDSSALEQSLALGSGGGGQQPGEGEDLSAAGLDDMSDDEDTEAASLPSVESAETADLTAGTMTTTRPGMLGNQTQLQFDVSRLPRIEEYQVLINPDNPGAVTDVPSDIKTICYYVQQAGGEVTDPLTVSESTRLGPSTTTGGLVRRSVDRAVTKWSLENGGMASLVGSGDLLASEVASLEFRYWDGLQWQIYWDSDEFGTLPMAIEITLTMVEQRADAADPATTDLTRQYVHIVRLPMGRPVEQDTMSSGMSAAGI